MQTPCSKRQAPPILVIEDNPDHWFFIRWALTRTFPDLQPVWLRDPAQVLDYLDACESHQRPRLILLDLYLPDRITGWRLLEAIKTHPAYRHIPVMILSGSTDAEDIGESYRQRANSYLVKPTDQQGWLTCFAHLRQYWWHTVTLTKAAN